MSHHLEGLVEMEGVLVAGEFNSEGECLGYKAKMEITPELEALTAQYANAITQLFTTMATAYSQLSGMNWLPQDGWVFCGGDYIAICGQNTIVVAENKTADVMKIIQALTPAEVAA